MILDIIDDKKLTLKSYLKVVKFKKKTRLNPPGVEPGPHAFITDGAVGRQVCYRCTMDSWVGAFAMYRQYFCCIMNPLCHDTVFIKHYAST